MTTRSDPSLPVNTARCTGVYSLSFRARFVFDFSEGIFEGPQCYHRGDFTGENFIFVQLYIRLSVGFAVTYLLINHGRYEEGCETLYWLHLLPFSLSKPLIHP